MDFRRVVVFGRGKRLLPPLLLKHPSTVSSRSSHEPSTHTLTHTQAPYAKQSKEILPPLFSKTLSQKWLSSRRVPPPSASRPPPAAPRWPRAPARSRLVARPRSSSVSDAAIRLSRRLSRGSLSPPPRSSSLSLFLFFSFERHLGSLTSLSSSPSPYPPARPQTSPTCPACRRPLTTPSEYSAPCAVWSGSAKPQAERERRQVS